MWILGDANVSLEIILIRDAADLNMISSLWRFRILVTLATESIEGPKIRFQLVDFHVCPGSCGIFMQPKFHVVEIPSCRIPKSSRSAHVNSPIPIHRTPYLTNQIQALWVGTTLA